MLLPLLRSTCPASLTLMVGLAGATSAWAGLPLQTDDAGVLAGAECELEVMAERLAAGAAKAEGQGLAAGCGIGWRSQLGLAFATARADGVRTDAWALGGKTALWRGGEGEDAPALALSWSLDWARSDGSGWQHAATELALVYSAPAGAALTWHASLAHARDQLGHTSATGWGLALEHAGWELAGVGVAPMAELVGDDRESPWWNAGLRATLAPERAWLGLSYGRQTDGERASLTTAGLKLAF